MATTAETRVEFANALRGVAALSVLVSHYFGVFWTDNATASQLVAAPPMQNLNVPNFITALTMYVLPIKFGAFGVALFFVISGFVIPFSFEKYSASGFLIGRALRIFPTYAAGFAISILSLIVSARYFGVAVPYSPGHVAIHAVPGLLDLLWLPSIDGVVWTLEVELKFYLICALMAPWLRRGSLLVFIAPVGLYIFARSAPHWIDDLAGTNAALLNVARALTLYAPHLMFMFIGVALNFAHRRLQREMPMVAISAVLFFGFMLLWTSGIWKQQATLGWSYGAACALFLAALALSASFAGTRVTGFFADISYPLYVSHPLLGYAGLRIMLDLGVPRVICLVAVTAGALAMAYALHRLVEKPTREVGKRLGRSFSKERGSPAPAATVTP